MASQYITVKKYTGVCYIESKSKRFRGRPDRIYWVRFKDIDKEGDSKIRYDQARLAAEAMRIRPEAANSGFANLFLIAQSSRAVL